LGLAFALLAATELGLQIPFHANPLACLLLGTLATLLPQRWCSRSLWVAFSVLFTCFLLRAQGLAIPTLRAPDNWSALNSRVTPNESNAIIGRYRQLVGSLGWLDSGDGIPPTSALKIADCELSDGDWIAIPREVQVVDWPRGKRPGGMGQRFPAGLLHLQADEVVRLSASPYQNGFAPFDQKSERSLSLSERAAQLRTKLSKQTGWLFAPELAGIARALLFGDRSSLSPDVSDLFTRTGTRHLLAVSGMHIALAAALFLLPLSKLLERLLGGTRGRIAGFILFAFLIVTFTAFAGRAAPVVRAAFALGLASLARHIPGRSKIHSTSGRQADALSLWSLALVIELLIDPRATRSLSIQLSYLATLGILLGTRPISQLFSQFHLALFRRNAQPQQPLLPAQVRWWRILFARTGRSVYIGLAASCAAVLATLPVAWHQFGEWSPIGVLVTTLTLPLFVLIMASLWTTATLALCFTSSLLVNFASGSLQLLLDVLDLIDRLPFTPLPLPERPIALVACASACTIIALASQSRTLKRTAALCFGALLLPWSAAPSGLELELLDVGHGTALLLRAPGEPCLIFDVGSRDRQHLYREALAPQLARWEVSDPTIVLTHSDRDHASGLAKLVERYPPSAWLGELQLEIAERLPSDCVRLDLPTGSLSYVYNDGPLKIRLLRGSDESGNEGSRALIAEVGSRRVMLFGDSEGVGLGQMIHSGELTGPVDLMLFPHHGSETPWLSALLELTQPKQIWVSATAPPALTAEFDRRGLDWSVTARDGPLSIQLTSIEAAQEPSPSSEP
jgi:competence protein ComEC